MTRNQILPCICFIGLTTLLGVHFLMTIAVTLPPTPLATEYGKAIDAWMYPYFAQSWSFFAPTPPVEDDYVITQYRYVTPSGATADSPWINLSRTLNEVVQRDRFSSLGIVQATVIAAYGDLIKSDVFKKGKLDQKVFQDLARTHKQLQPLHVLERVSMSCYPIMNLQGKPLQVRVGILTHEFPRFTHRNQPDNQSLANSELQFPFVQMEPVASFN